MKRFWMSAGLPGAVVALFSLLGLGLTGCGGDDGDEPAPVVVVVTNVVTGVVQTNVVVASPDADANIPVVVALNPLTVNGRWNGPISSGEGNGHMELEVELSQAGALIRGQFCLKSDFGGDPQIGNVVAAQLDVDQLKLTLRVPGVPGVDAKMELDGRVNAKATEYIGTWAGLGDEGGFWLQK